MPSKYFPRPFRTPELGRSGVERGVASRGTSCSGPPWNARSTQRSAIAWLTQTRLISKVTCAISSWTLRSDFPGECSQDQTPRASRRNSAIISSSACACVGSSNPPSQNLSLSLRRSSAIFTPVGIDMRRERLLGLAIFSLMAFCYEIIATSSASSPCGRVEYAPPDIEMKSDKAVHCPPNKIR
jgi:hypothetical protein